MPANIEDVLANSNFEVVLGAFKYQTVGSRPESKSHFAVIDDGSEITVVTSDWEDLDIVKQNPIEYALINLRVIAPFNAPGFIAAVSKAIADLGCVCLVISTFSNDFVLVSSDRIADAIGALESIGLRKL